MRIEAVSEDHDMIEIFFQIHVIHSIIRTCRFWCRKVGCGAGWEKLLNITQEKL